jgi:threonine dehydrogenase-like Zn-dependent dehydrogenase
VGALPESARYDGMVDGSGNAAAIATAERLLAPGAKAVLVGLGDETPRIRPGGAPLLGSFGYRDDEFARAVELIAGGRVRLGSIVTHIFPLERADQALDSRRWDPTVVKAAIVPQKEQK